jgi:hypothetical protein
MLNLMIDIGKNQKNSYEFELDKSFKFYLQCVVNQYIINSKLITHHFLKRA